MAHEISGVSTCQLCGERFYGPMGAISLMNSGRPGRAALFMQSMMQHLEEKHPQHYRAIEIKAAEYCGMLRILNFRTTDSEIAETAQKIRWAVLQQVLNARVSDSSIVGLSGQFSRTLLDNIFAAAGFADLPGAAKLYIESIKPKLVELTISQVHKLLTEFRDAVQEPDRFPVEPGGPITGPVQIVEDNRKTAPR